MAFIDNCPGCPYGGRSIGPRGDTASSVVLVGEAPGPTEIEVGEPFRGPAGEVLGLALAKSSLWEPDVLITNAVACLPHPVRPRAVAIRSCGSRLANDLAAHPRRVIVALGATAVRAVTGQRGIRITQLAPDTDLPSAWGLVVPTLHPAFVRRRGLRGPEYQRLVHDLRRARRRALQVAM